MYQGRSSKDAWLKTTDISFLLARDGIGASSSHSVVFSIVSLVSLRFALAFVFGRCDQGQRTLAAGI